MNGNINNTKDISKHPRKSFLFFLTGYIIYINNRFNLGINLLGDKVKTLGKQYNLCTVWCMFDNP